MISITIGTPIYREPHSQFLQSIEMCKKDPRMNVNFIMCQGNGLIDNARAYVLGDYLSCEKPSEWFCMIDDDIEFHPELLYRMLAMDVNVIGAAYAYKCSDGPKKELPVLRLLEGAEPINNLVEVRYLGGGFTCVRDSFLRKMIDHYQDLGFNQNPLAANEPCGKRSYALWQPLLVDQPLWGEGKKEYLSEDWAFCERARQMGEKLYVDLRAIVGHWSGNTCYVLPHS